jgi:hypothetical protein
MGMPYDAPHYLFPAEMFLADSDLTPLSENIEDIVWGLTKWEPEVKKTGLFAPPMVIVEGKDYAEAITNVNEQFYKGLMTDGLPIQPPTRERVEWMLKGTDLSPDTVVGKILPRGGVATVEALAVNAVMAGCRPEYMPVLIAAVEAILEPEFRLQSMQATTNPATPLLIVNGPIRQQLDINYRSGIFGPGFQSNATIGRALRLIMINPGGAFPGITSMSTHGQPGRYTMCIAENEEALPAGWEPLNVELGFPPGSNTVAVFQAQDITKLGYGGLTAMAGGMKTNKQLPRCYGDGEVLCIFGPDDIAWVVQGIDISRDVGTVVIPPYTNKEDIKKFLFEESRIPWEEYLRGFAIDYGLNRDFIKPGGQHECLLQYVGGTVPVVQSWDKILVIVAGGVGLHSVFVSNWGRPTITKEIKLPANWDALLEEAKPHVREPFA